MSPTPLLTPGALLADAIAGGTTAAASSLGAGTLEVAAAANISGSDGNDTLNGSANADQLSGLAGDDTLNGRGGNDVLSGGDGNDVLTGGTGDDQVLGDAGDDRIVWNEGDGNDLVDGGDGNDRLEIRGDASGETVQLLNNGTHVFVSVTNGGGVTSTLDVAGVESIVVTGSGGDDTLSAGNGLATLTSLTLDGGAGNDTLLGGDGNDTLLGGSGNDFVDGNRGNDTADLGGGNDVFGWDPGDGSDVVEGGSGTDTLQFNGSNANEDMVLAASGSHALLTRNVAAITMDLHGMETVNIRTLGGTDNITIGDLRGTDVKQVHVDLAGFDGSDDASADTVTVALTAGDDAIAFAAPIGAPVITALGTQVFVDNQGAGDRFVIDGGAGIDTATVNGTGGDDGINIARDGNAVAVFATGQTSFIDVANIEQLKVVGGNGNDTISAQNGIGALTQLTIDGGAGNDIIRGGDGNDVLIGGSGNDFVDGNIGSDVADLGAGDDVFGWDPGDGSDVVEGGSGTDTLQFNGSNAGETMTLAANGNHALLTRNVANIAMDLHGMEVVNIRALGSADAITIGDLRGTDVKQVHVDLAGFDGNDDQTADTVTVALTAADDAFAFAVPTNGVATVGGLGAQVFVDNLGVGDHFVIDGGSGVDTLTATGTGGDDVIGIARDGTNAIAVFGAGQPVIDVVNTERLLVVGGNGNDSIAAQNGIGTLTQLTIDGGVGNDDIRGGDGNDILLGGSGNDFVDGNIGSDVADLGAGNDVFGWDPGDGSDVVEGGSGIDTLQFNGSNAGENIALAANGSHATLTRNIANITMDLHGMEIVNIRALGSSDNITIGDLGGSNVKEVHVDLGGFDGGDDGAIDTVTVALTADSDAYSFTVSSGAAALDGLGARVFVDHQGVGDHFVLDTAGGVDAVTAKGTDGDDVIGIARDATFVAVFGQGQVIDLANSEQLKVTGGDGNDTINAQNGIGALTQLTIDGGAGDDTIRGGDGNDILFGGNGNDTVAGGIGSDSAQLGAGDDVFVWGPGDGSDLVEGGSGNDTLQFNGSNAGEQIALSANGSHAVLTRNIANITMDLHGMEAVDVRALGSADDLVVHDLKGTEVRHVNIDLAGFDGAGDAANDVVTVEGTAGNDAITLSMRDGALVVGGLTAEVVIQNFETGDTLRVLGLGGDDIIDASALPAGMALVLDGGDGDDVVLGGDGNDMLLGGAGDDVLIGGPGQDVLDGGIGDNVLIQDGGNPLFAADVHTTDLTDHAPLAA